MLKVGLTGNIGSGKSLVAEIFRVLDVPVFQADKEAHKLFDEEGFKEQIRSIFGKAVFSPSGDVLRREVAAIVFNDENALASLNKIVHPTVRKRYHNWCLQNDDQPYTLYEAAILFESGHYLEMDKIICVTAPEELRISRVMARDNVSEEEVMKRIKNQWAENEKVRLSDFIIRNDETESLILQVLEVHRKLAGTWNLEQLQT